MNARAAMPDGGELLIATENRTDLAAVGGAGICLSVTDVGTGMEPAVAQRAFEPFFTTRPKGQGTGLGLATAYGAVTDAGGIIELDSELGRGTTVRVCLPAGSRQTAAASAPATEPAVGDGESVLLVEDEDAVREVVLRILTRAGYRVRQVGSPLEALRIFESGAEHFDVLLTDIVMPGMSGTQLASRLRELRPSLPVLFMSGYTTGPAPGGHELPSDGSLLHKPFDRSALLEALARVLRAARQTTEA
jgi:CheY-like chemotaxis protein